MTDWQPIETAPRDGRVILLGNQHGAWFGRYCDRYSSGYRPKNPWESLMLNHEYMGGLRHPPTHWTHLPEPPK